MQLKLLTFTLIFLHFFSRKSRMNNNVNLIFNCIKKKKMYLKDRMIGWGGGDLPSADHPEWPQQPGLCQGTARIQELHIALLDRFHKDPHTQVTKCCLSRHMCREQDQKQSWWDCNMHWDIGFWYCNRQLSYSATHSTIYGNAGMHFDSLASENRAQGN